MKVEFAYRILPKAEMAHDGKGNATGGYIRIVLDVEEEYYAKEYNDTHIKLLPLVAKKSMIDKSYIQPISLEEYYAEHAEHSYE